jgi:hypothetical protein
MLDGTASNMAALVGDGWQISDEVEFAVVFASGKVFYTGGYENAKSLIESLGKNEESMGSYNPIASAWSPTTLPGAIESVIDFRTDSKEE